MIIWFAILIPVIFAIMLLLLFRHKTLWWEFFLPFVASIIVIGASYMVAVSLATNATEYWGNYFVKAEHYEPWNELVHYTVQVACGTDKKGHTRYRTEHRTRIDYHPASWVGELNSGSDVGISEEQYVQMKSKWTNEEFVNMHRKYHSINGNKYESNFKEGEENIFPYFSTHWYVNKVKASKSVFKFKEVDKADFGLFDYPEVSGNYVPTILGDIKDKEKANKVLDNLNAKYGQDKKVRVWLLFFKNKPLQAGLDQENYWMGGNKNEFVVCIGLNNNEEVEWCYPFSWSEKELLKVQIRDCAINMKPFDVFVFAWTLRDKVIRDFEKKSFKDFDYLTIEPSTTAILIAFLLTLLVNVGVSFYVIMNEFEEGADLKNKEFLGSLNRYRRW